MDAAALIAGGLLLVFGRKLFWLFVGVVGFFAGMNLAGQLFPDQTTVLLAAGVALGIVAALLAVFVQRLAVLVAGFLAGGYLLVTLLGMFGGAGQDLSWLPFVIGGVLGAALLSVLFDWALVALSSLVGAVLIARYSGVDQPLSLILVAGLTILGIVVQAGVISGRGRNF